MSYDDDEDGNESGKEVEMEVAESVSVHGTGGQKKGDGVAVVGNAVTPTGKRSRGRSK